MRKPKKIELFKFKGCEGCQKNCLWNTQVAIREIAEKDKNKFPCNLSIAKIWVDKTFKEDK